MPEIKEGVSDLLFGLHNEGNNLYSAKIVKIKNGKISEWKHGVGTSLGHALNIAEDIMGAYIVQSIEKSAEDFYNDITVI
jgi:hypothetical protein